MFAKLSGQPVEGEVPLRLVETRQVPEGGEEQNGAGKDKYCHIFQAAFIRDHMLDCDQRQK